MNHYEYITLHYPVISYIRNDEANYNDIKCFTMNILSYIPDGFNIISNTY